MRSAEGEFRKRVQFMYGGRLEHIRFRYTGPSLEAVLDRAVERFTALNGDYRDAATAAQAYAGMMMPAMGNLSKINYAVDGSRAMSVASRSFSASRSRQSSLWNRAV